MDTDNWLHLLFPMNQNPARHDLFSSEKPCNIDPTLDMKKEEC